MKFHMTTKLFTGENIIFEHENIFKELGNKCLIITGKNSAIESGALKDVEEILKRNNIEYLIFDGVIANPLMETCVIAGKYAYESKVDYTIAIGGGSVLDSGKVIALVANNPELNEDLIYQSAWKNKPIPLVMIGLTSGTGSEVTDAAVCTNKKGLKKSIHDPILYGEYAFGDPRYTMSLNYDITLSTALDALAHSVESYFSNKADDLSRAFSISAINKLWNNLVLLKDKNINLNLTQRQELYDASIIAGLAINITATSFAHNVGYYLTENYNIPHGFACAIFMEDVIENAWEYDIEYANNFFRQINKTKEEYISLIRDLLPDFNIEMTKEEINNALPRWENNATVKNTRGGISIDKIENVLINKFLK